MVIQKGMAQKLGKPITGHYRGITRAEYCLTKELTILIPQKGYICNDNEKLVFLSKSKKPIQLSDAKYSEVVYALEKFWNT